MVGFQRMLRVLAPLAVICGALFAASCGGSNSTPSSTPTTYPSTVSQTFTLYAGSTTIGLAQVGTGAYATINYGGSAQPSPFPSAGITLSVNSYSSAPSGSIGPSSVARKTLSQGNATGYAPTGVYYYTATVSTSLALNVFTCQILTLSPNNPVNVPYYLEIDDLTSGTWINTYPGTAVSSGTVTFGSANGYLPSVSLANLSFGSHTLLYQFYYLNGTSAPATASPVPTGSAALPTPTPAVVSTTVPAGSTANAFTLPVTAGGYVGSGTIPAGSGSGSVTVIGTSQEPLGISTSNNELPFYIFGFSSGASVALAASPPVTIQLPSNFATTYQILGALCTTAACPVQAQDGAIVPIPSNSGGVGAYSFAAGAFPDFTTVGATPQYIIAYINRSTPVGGVSSPVPIAAGASAAIPVPAVPPSPASSQITSTVTIGGLSAATTATVYAQTGLFPEMTAIVPNTQTVFYAFKVVTSGAVTTTANALCGSASCSVATVIVPPDVMTAAGSKTYYVEQCSSSNCPVTGISPVAVTLSGNQLVVPAPFGNVASVSPTSPVYYVFYYM